jgi:hypothetical protein
MSRVASCGKQSAWYHITVREAPEVCVGDLDGDGEVGLADLTALLSAYGTTCP